MAITEKETNGRKVNLSPDEERARQVLSLTMRMLGLTNDAVSKRLGKRYQAVQQRRTGETRIRMGDASDLAGAIDVPRELFDVCTQYVKGRLRAPGTASFPNQHEDDGEVVISGGPDVYTVTSHVDAENGFGGEVRNRFVCKVRHGAGGNWTLVDLAIL